MPMQVIREIGSVEFKANNNQMFSPWSVTRAHCIGGLAGILLISLGVLVAACTSPEEEVFQKGKQNYLKICATCHLQDGRGMAAHLVQSRWVLGDDEILIRIVLHGKKGRSDMDMPPHPQLDDESIASILTYVRREWGHQAPAVQPDTVARVRVDSISRHEQWTQSELQELERRLSEEKPVGPP